MRGGQFIFENLDSSVGRNKQKAIYALKLAINLLSPDDLFNPIDCGRVTLCDQPGAFCTEQAFKLIEPIVQGVRQMRGCPGGHPATDWPIVEHDHRLTFLREKIRSRQSCDSGPDYDDVRTGVGTQRFFFRRSRGRYPN